MYEVPAPDELKKFMFENNLTGADIAALTGVNPRTARRWVAPADQNGAKPIPWSDWALILLLTKKMNIETILKKISEWKAERTKFARPLFERANSGRPIKEKENEKLS
jgi:hypothetical protein